MALPPFMADTDRVTWFAGVVLLTVVFAAWAARRSRPISGSDRRVVVRCRDGHLFTTVWVPFVSFKSLRFGAWRWQRCPVAGHWTFVAPLPDDQLTDSERRLAEHFPDGPIP